ncbi:MAG: helix-turn-helix transcriptional regulator [Chloroflexi bacterium]|nr:helix-turn-helix transcriptional regulator [Chloroflexota bacterium]
MSRGVSFSDMTCSIARSLDIVGERWTMLILREAFRGVRRFDAFLSLGIARNVLADRLQTLVEQGIFERRLYQTNPERFEYRLTEKGVDFFPVLMALMQWGDRHLAGAAGPPVLLQHEACGHAVEAELRCLHCDAPVTARQTRSVPGPGMPGQGAGS